MKEPQTSTNTVAVATMEDKPFIVACIPAFNEEKTIAKVVLQASRYVDARACQMKNAGN
jgi:hypothetical protein